MATTATILRWRLAQTGRATVFAIVHESVVAGEIAVAVVDGSVVPVAAAAVAAASASCAASFHLIFRWRSL